MYTYLLVVILLLGFILGSLYKTLVTIYASQNSEDNESCLFCCIAELNQRPTCKKNK